MMLLQPWRSQARWVILLRALASSTPTTTPMEPALPTPIEVMHAQPSTIAPSSSLPVRIKGSNGSPEGLADHLLLHLITYSSFISHHPNQSSLPHQAFLTPTPIGPSTGPIDPLRYIRDFTPLHSFDPLTSLPIVHQPGTDPHPHNYKDLPPPPYFSPIQC